MRRLLVAALVLAAALPQGVGAARYAVGARSVAALAPLRAALPGAESLAPIPALVVEADFPPRLAALPGATYVERLGSRRIAFEPSDPLAARQVYLSANHAFDFWETLPILPPVRVGVIDSGIDYGHPEFAGKIAATRSFVGGSARVDTRGHGTFVAGLIAAAIDNSQGIAGMAPSAELVIAKVVKNDDTIDVEAEARAIRWAVASGARVLNMSIGGVRDPADPGVDTYSPLEAAAIAFAVSRDVVVVAAVGNADASPREPWLYASYPAALPHVVGVSALARDGSAPLFSNRDRVYNDIAASGQGILSTFPRALTAPFRDCVEQGYSSCAPDDYRDAEGTSFAAPQVSAAAAVLFAVRPSLRAEQVTALLTRTATDAEPATGCRRCPLGRDELTGWGRLDVAAALRALSGPIPAVDRLEPNDDAGPRARKLWGKTIRVEASLDFWDDQNDVYAIKLRKGQSVYASVRGPGGADTNLILWKPAATEVNDLRRRTLVARQSARPGPRDYLAHRAPKAGWYFVQVKLSSPGAGPYTLVVVKS